MKKPEAIILSLVGATVVGTAGMSLLTPSRKEEQPPQTQNDWTSQSEEPPVSEDQEYTNDTYVPGAGYYHAPYHSFFPYRYNYYDSARGYYHGGSWWPQASLSNIFRSRPNSSAAASARSGQSSYFSTHPSSSRGVSSTGGGSSGKTASSHGSSSSTSSGTSHGGFGSTGHSSAGSSSSS